MQGCSTGGENSGAKRPRNKLLMLCRTSRGSALVSLINFHHSCSCFQKKKLMKKKCFLARTHFKAEMLRTVGELVGSGNQETPRLHRNNRKPVDLLENSGQKRSSWPKRHISHTQKRSCQLYNWNWSS